MSNATYLTEKYPGQESELWTPCIDLFFRVHTPLLPVSVCIDAPSAKGPWFESRKQSPYLKVVGDVLREPGPDDFLPRVGARYGLDLMNHPGRITTKGDIAGICPDIILIKPDKQGVSIIENKPYYESTFDGNQGPGGAYIDCVDWLNAAGIPCEYLLIHSISWKQYPTVKQVQDIVRDRFRVVLLEDIFVAMAQNQFKYGPIREPWSQFAEKGSDYA
jgi:hypothetical protein